MAAPEKGDWMTPPWFLDLVRKVDKIEMDPCASTDPKYHFAARNFTETDDGLAQSWFCGYEGLVFCNPPYSKGQIERWAQKAVEEAPKDVEIIMLLPGYLERGWWQTILAPRFDAACYLGRRMVFVDPKTGEPADGNGWFGNIVVYLGDRSKVFEKAFAGQGFLIRPVGR